MTSTAFDDQFTAAPEPVHQPYDTSAILRRNVADMEKELQRLGNMASHWKRQYAIMYDEMQGTPCAKIRWQHERAELVARAEAAEAELAKAREQKPVLEVRVSEYSARVTKWVGKIPYGLHQLYAAPVPAPAVPAAHDLIITNIVNADLWVQGGKVYARCANTGDGTGCFAFGDRRFGVTVDTWALMINLEQSAPPRDVLRKLRTR